jgi:predicted TIM-barrel fold metal-dependent hydrolase
LPLQILAADFLLFNGNLMKLDTDIHNTVPNAKALYPYLSDYWIDQLQLTGFAGATDKYYPVGASVTARSDTHPKGGGAAGSNLETLRKQALDIPNTDIGILNCLYAVDGIHNPDAALALSQAVNDWQLNEWLNKEPRLRASIVVPPQYPELAAEEIRRIGNRPEFVQVLLPVRAPQPYGNRNYHPIYKAASECDLKIAIHFGGVPGTPATPTGWPTFYIEEYAGMSSVFQSQILSIISGGILNHFPNLKMIFLESGWTWLPSLMWRFDKDWKGIRREIPWLTQSPSEYIRKHMRFSLTPTDAPPKSDALLEIIEQIGSEDLILYSSDYPHNHDSTLPSGLPNALIQKIMHKNAQKFYGF